MPINLKQLRQATFNLTTITFACTFMLIIPFILTVSGFQLFPGAPPALAANASSTGLTDFSAIDRNLELQGSPIAHSDQRAVTDISFTIANTVGTEPINLADNSLQLSYRDGEQRISHLVWSHRFQGIHDNDALLEAGERVHLTVALSSILKTKLGANTPFVIDITPAQGAILSIHRITPAKLNPTIEFE